MKKKSLAPKFLISEKENNAIIKTKLISYIKFNEINNTCILCPSKTIRFRLKDKEDIFWQFEQKEEALEEYQLIISELNKYVIS